MLISRCCLILLVVVLSARGASAAEAIEGVIVVGNWTDRDLSLSIQASGAAPRPLTLRPHEVRGLAVSGRVAFVLAQDGGSQRFEAAPNGIFLFTRDASGITGRDVGLGRKWPPSIVPAGPTRPVAAGIATISVKLLVDDHEPATQKVWEPRVRERVAAASAILERHCGLRLEVVGVGTWKRDPAAADFSSAVADFQRQVDPRPARLAIGLVRGLKISADEYAKAGGMVGPLGDHLLIPEIGLPGDQLGLRLLLHALGLWLGASHCPDPDSAMRTLLSMPLPRERLGDVRFDPANSFLMSLTAAEIRTRGVRTLSAMRPATRRDCLEAYDALADVFPSDEVAGVEAYVRFWCAPPAAGVRPLSVSPALAQDVRRARDAILNASADSAAAGDALLEEGIRRAATTLRESPPERAAPALLLGLALALCDGKQPGDPELLRETSSTILGPVINRTAVNVTLGGWHEAARDFALAAGLTALTNPSQAETLCVAERIREARRGGGTFSRARMAATFAGVAFAAQLVQVPVNVAEVAEQFHTAGYTTGSLSATNIPWQELIALYRDPWSDGLAAEWDSLHQQAEMLPGVRASRTPHSKELVVPDFLGATAIYSGTTTDHEGHVWMAVSADFDATGSAHLYEYEPGSGKSADRGDAIGELRRAGLARDHEQQALVPTPLVCGSDGHLYFATTGSGDASKSGSHLWRLRLPERRWERLTHLNEAVTGLAVRDEQIVILTASPGPVLARFDLRKGTLTSEQLSEAAGQIMGGPWLDHRGHLFLTRLAPVTPATAPSPLSLVELNGPLSLRELQAVPLEETVGGGVAPAIVGWVEQADGFTIFATRQGVLRRITAHGPDPATIERLGEMGPAEKTKLESLAGNGTGGLLGFGFERAPSGDAPRWFLFNLKRQSAEAFSVQGENVPNGMRLKGPVARDAANGLLWAGYYDRGPLHISPTLLDSLKSRGASEESLTLLRDNAKRLRQPLLFRVQGAW